MKLETTNEYVFKQSEDIPLVSHLESIFGLP